jgi:hypothetical protein
MVYKDGIKKINCDEIFDNIDMKDDFNNFSFLMWKSELQKELPNFWEIMNRN